MSVTPTLSSRPDLVFLLVPFVASCMSSATLDSTASMPASGPGAAAAGLFSGVAAAPRLNLTDLLVLLAPLFFVLLPCGATLLGTLLAGDLVSGALSDCWALTSGLHEERRACRTLQLGSSLAPTAARELLCKAVVALCNLHSLQICGLVVNYNKQLSSCIMLFAF